jgi:hypothetical protein
MQAFAARAGSLETVSGVCPTDNVVDTPEALPLIQEA